MLEHGAPLRVRGGAQGRLEAMTSCDYNGWNDSPEEEREWFDQHPEIWGRDPAETHLHPRRAARGPLPSRQRGGMAA